jgi:hypothetical protein
MTVTQARGIANKAKKHPPILHVARRLTLAAQANVSRFGRRLIRLQVGPQRRSFSAHEDMLCMRSKVFRDRFQTARKDVEGECVLCHEDLDAMGEDLTYCKTCGNNLHQDCMDQWSHTNNTCPTCRAVWVKSPFINTFNLEDTDADGFDVYVQWLYRCAIPTYAADKEDVRFRCRRLVKAHVVGDNLGDEEFVKVVRCEIIKCSLGGTFSLSVTALKWAYSMTDGSCILRRFMTDLYALHGNRGNWLGNSQAAKLSHAIFVDLLKSPVNKTKLQTDEEAWTIMAKGGYIEEKDATDDVREE